jgi:hypothetical protein
MELEMSLSIETELRRALADVADRRDRAITGLLDTIGQALSEAVELGRELGRAETVLASVTHAVATGPTAPPRATSASRPETATAETRAERPREGTAAETLLRLLEKAGVEGLPVADLNAKMEKAGFKRDATDKAKAKLKRELFAINSTAPHRWWTTSALPSDQVAALRRSGGRDRGQSNQGGHDVDPPE